MKVFEGEMYRINKYSLKLEQLPVAPWNILQLNDT